jgi:hypothetical protein
MELNYVLIPYKQVDATGQVSNAAKGSANICCIWYIFGFHDCFEAECISLRYLEQATAYAVPVAASTASATAGSSSNAVGAAKTSPEDAREVKRLC